jgi:hypothetical protein
MLGTDLEREASNWRRLLVKRMIQYLGLPLGDDSPEIVEVPIEIVPDDTPRDRYVTIYMEPEPPTPATQAKRTRISTTGASRHRLRQSTR